MILEIQMLSEKMYVINKSCWIREDSYNAEKIGIDPKLYIHLLEKYGAKIYPSNVQHWFSTYREAERFLNSPELEPYLIMAEITS